MPVRLIPAPSVGPALTSKGVNITAFCKEYNAKTSDKAEYVIPIKITIFDVQWPIKEEETLGPAISSVGCNGCFTWWSNGSSPDIVDTTAKSVEYLHHG